MSCAPNFTLWLSLVYLLLPRNNLCPLNHTVCGPGPTIGVTADPPTSNPIQGSLAHPLIPLGSTRNLIATVLGIVLLLVGLTIYAIFGKRPRQKLQEWRRRRQMKKQELGKVKETRYPEEGLESVTGKDGMVGGKDTEISPVLGILRKGRLIV